MKTTYLITALCALFLICGSAAAQTDSLSTSHNTWDIRLGVSAVSISSSSQVKRYSSYNYDKLLHNMYGDYSGPLTSSPNFAAEAMVHLSKKSALGVAVSVCFHNYRIFSAVGNDKQVSSVTSAALYVLPTYRLYYLNKDMVRLYGNVSLGLTSYFNTDISGSKYIPQVAFNISPIGVEVGRRWFGFAELGFGTVYCGVSLGFGYKF